MNRNTHNQIKKAIFKDYEETVWVYLKKTNTKGANYDVYRNTGHSVTNQSPEPVKAYVRQIQGNSLIARDIGLSQSGAIEIVIESKDENLFRICEKVKYNDVLYSPFNEALGNKVQIYKSEFNFSRVVLFRQGN